MNISVLRLSHRISRDKRMSTHLALTARAFGARELYYSGEHDTRIEASIQHIIEEWGGNFTIKYVKNPRELVKSWKNKGNIIVHLTMFGVDLSEKIDQLKSNLKDILVIVGGAKVPIEYYHLADFNIAIGYQPHSEVAALAVFLNDITAGSARLKKYNDAKIEIVPTEIGKKAIRREK